MLINTRIIVTLRSLRNGEHAEFTADLVSQAKADVVAVPQVVPAWNAFEAVANHESLLFRVSSESAETHLISGEDKDRDRIFKEVKRILKYNAEDKDPAVSEPAGSLLFVLKPYEKAPSTNLFEETKYIRNFLGAINKLENAPAIDAIPGLAPMLLKLEAANVKLHDLYQQRLQALEALARMGRPADIRKDADKALVALFEAINIVHAYNEMALYDNSIKTKLESAASYVHALVAQVHRILAGRSHPHGRKKPGAGKPGKPAAPDAPATGPQNPENTPPQAPDTPPQNPSATPPGINPDDLNPPAVGER
jgi:hypothetical protein